LDREIDMATKAQAVKAVEAAGGSIDWNVSEITATEKVITVDAPEGSVWQFNGSECICLAWHSGPASELWDEVIDAVEFGTEAA
jgi:hypothetical protein